MINDYIFIFASTLEFGTNHIFGQQKLIWAAHSHGLVRAFTACMYNVGMGESFQDYS